MLFYIEIIRGNDYYQYLIRHPLCKSLVKTLRHSVCIYIYIHIYICFAFPCCQWSSQLN